MPIQFCDLLSDQEWAPYTVDADDPRARWHDGAALAAAPVDVAAALHGVLQVSTGVDPAFNAFGWRLRAGATLPRRHHDARHLVIVFGGEATVTWGADGTDGQNSFHLGEFWVTEPGTPYTVTAGPEDVVYVESWSAPVADVGTWWHDGPWTGSGS